MKKTEVILEILIPHLKLWGMGSYTFGWPKNTLAFKIKDVQINVAVKRVNKHTHRYFIVTPNLTLRVESLLDIPSAFKCALDTELKPPKKIKLLKVSI